MPYKVFIVSLSSAARSFRLQALLAALFACAMVMPVPGHAHGLMVGQPAPPITLHTLDGKQIDTRDLHGKVVIVTFWATWCGPCREELPVLSHFAREHARDGLVVLGFSLDTPDDLGQVRDVAATLNFPVGLLGDPHVAGYGRIWHLPVSFVIDRDGRLMDDGWKDKDPVWTAERLRQVVAPLLAQAAQPPAGTKR